MCTVHGAKIVPPFPEICRLRNVGLCKSLAGGAVGPESRLSSSFPWLFFARLVLFVRETDRGGGGGTEERSVVVPPAAVGVVWATLARMSGRREEPGKKFFLTMRHLPARPFIFFDYA